MFFEEQGQPHPMTGVEKLIQRIESNDSNLKISTFSDACPLLPKYLQRLTEALPTNTHLKTLEIIDCCLTLKTLKLLTEAIEQNKSLTAVRLEKFENDDEDRLALLQRVNIHVQQNQNEALLPIR
jgi:hypothetical protein